MPSPWTADSSQITADSGYFTADGSFIGPAPQVPSGGISASQLAKPQPTLTATIKSYLYQQYANDDDLQAFVAAFNAATQTYVDWFNSVNLPFYPGLTGPLLDWVANGLYGLQRTSLTQTVSGAVGPLNTTELNTQPLNAFTAPTSVYYNITDDVFKRILTWNFYKGDGKRFCMKWLKRRIMRFLVGTDGLDPNPLSPDFVVGPENTQAVSVTVASDVLTVTINGAYISSLVQLQPQIIDIFKAAFLGGVLDLPVQYTYAVNVVTSLTATASPPTESVTGIATTLSTGTASVSALGGNGAYTFAWTWASGGTGITINAPSAADTSFTATGITRGATLTGVAKCTVTDSASHTAATFVTVTVKNISAPSVVLSPTALSVTGATASLTTGSTSAGVTGGAGPYSYAFTWQSGGAGLTINSPTGSSTNVTASGLSPGTSDTGALLCTVTDSYGQQTTATCAVTATRVSSLSVSVSPGSLSVSSSTVPMTTGAATVTASNGGPPYSYAWSFVWTSHTDGASESINSPTSASTSMTASGMSAGNTDTGNLQCVITDSYGQRAIENVSVSFTYLPPLTNTYTTAQNVTVPNGYTTAVVEEWGGGGGGQGGSGGSLCTATEGAGAGAAGYARSQFSVTGGQTIQITQVGVAGTPGATGFGVGTAGTATSVTVGGATLTANGGQPGNGSGGAGGTASGGNQANLTGASGKGVGQGAGGIATSGIYGNNSPAINGDGGDGGFRAGFAGKGGLVIIRFS